MSTFNETDAADALQILSEAAVERNEDFETYAAEADHEDTDDENDGGCPVFDTFYKQDGTGSIICMVNFDPQEFNTLWQENRKHSMEHFNIERGRKSPHTAEDVLFMTLRVIKHAGHWDMMAHLFGKRALHSSASSCDL